jgi:hypothetical protein
MKTDAERNGEHAHRLSSIAKLPSETITTLQANWIETAEEVLAVAATEQGAAGLKRLLELDEPTFDALLSSVRKFVGQHQSQAIGAASRPGGPLGVKLTEEQKARFGIRGRENNGKEA